MPIIALQLTDHEARIITEQDITPLLATGADRPTKGKLWFDLFLSQHDEWENLLNAMELSENDREVCLDSLPFPQAEALTGGGLVLRLPCRNAWTDEKNIYLTIALFKNLLVTVHEGAASPLEKTRRRLLEGDRPDAEDMPGLLLYTLQGLMEADVGDLLKVRTQVESMGDELENGDGVDGEAIRHWKHLVGHLAGQCEEQLFAMALLRSQIPHIPALSSIHADTGELVDSLNHIQRSLQRMEGRLADQLQRIDARLRNRTEQRLRVLTLVSAIFMPLTFITGFYGMNFDNMPILRAEWGYSLVVGVMAVLGCGMVAFFRWRGWFK